MKTTNHLLRILPILLFSLIIFSASAQNQKDENQMPPPPPHHGLNQGKTIHPPMAKEEVEEGNAAMKLPGITPEQREKIKKARLKQVADLTPLRNQLREKKARLATILATAPFDQKMADQVADEIGKDGTSILKLRIRHDQELRNILSPDQQVIFDARPKPWLNQRQ